MTSAAIKAIVGLMLLPMSVLIIGITYFEDQPVRCWCIEATGLEPENPWAPHDYRIVGSRRGRDLYTETKFKTWHEAHDDIKAHEQRVCGEP